MGFADLFRPRWKHSDPEVRAEAVRQLGDDQAALLASIARGDSDARVRRIAVKRIADVDVLYDVAAHDADESLRKAAGEKAEELLLGSANAGDLDALARLKQPRLLAAVAHKAQTPAARARALELLIESGDDKLVVDVLKRVPDVALRKLAVERLRDANALGAVALADGSKEVALAAVARLDDRAALEKVAQKAQSKTVRQAARDKLPPPEKKPETPEQQKRAKLLALVRAVEQASDPAELDVARAQFSQLGADDEMRRRFDRACERFYSRRAATAKKPAAISRQLSAQLADAQATTPSAVPAPAQAVIEATPVVDDKTEAEREAERAAREAEAAARAEEKQRRDEERRRRDEEKQRRDAEKAEARAHREAAEKANLERLTQLANELEAVVADEVKRGSDALKKAQQAFDALGRLPKEAAAEKARWQAARDKLRTRVNELYEAEEWKRWANVPKLEALCARAEALLEVTDLKQAATELKTLQAEWKTVGPTTKEKQQQLWTRFKTAADQVHERTRAWFATLDEQRGANLARKQELVARVEALAESSDWKETAELIKALQEEWKAVGPVPKENADEVWKRFRAACDKFFDRRKAHFDASDAERQKNLDRQLELCAAVEKLASSTDWKRTADEIKHLQAEWKRLGPAPKDKADETWKRFRAACDQFFAARQAHFAQLDEERGANLKAKELLCEKVEALAEAPDVEEAREVVRQLQAEWKTIGPAPKDTADAVWDRFRSACDRIYQRARAPEPAVSSPSGEPAAQGYAAPKLGDKLAELLKK